MSSYKFDDDLKIMLFGMLIFNDYLFKTFLNIQGVPEKMFLLKNDYLHQKEPFFWDTWYLESILSNILTSCIK